MFFLNSKFILCHCSGTLVNTIGFEWMLVGMAVICFAYAPLLTFLRAPPTREEKKVGIDNPGVVSDGGMTGGSDGIVVVASAPPGAAVENAVTKL